ncbi:MAG: SDR family NAD(P)-dependent oxidoreductase [Clostridiales bacterium]|nr:SDR family NAD(P)-dependent oxidoreductase [Clostridiales bacterium]
MKTVIITGASRGIGRATAEYFAEHDWRVIVNYNHSAAEATALVDTIRANNGEAYAFQADVGEYEQCKALVEYALSFGKVDALVNNAAISEVGLFDMLSIERERRLFDVDLFAPMNLSRLILPHMIHEKNGAIVNISSMWGQVGASCEVQYSTAKAAIIGFTKALAKEVAPSGIRVNCVAPGVIDTEMNAHLSETDISALSEEIPMCRIGTAREVAECIYFLCENGNYITGQIIAPNGGIVM